MLIRVGRRKDKAYQGYGYSRFGNRCLSWVATKFWFSEEIHSGLDLVGFDRMRILSSWKKES
jgi:hypothetical protein